MKLNKITACAAVLAMCAALAACGNTAEPEETTAAEVSSEQTTVPPVVIDDVNSTTAAPTEPVDLDAGLTDAMYERGLINEGDTSRLAAAMKKAQNGEDITVAVIGGSITQGTAASNNALCYGSLFFQWWQEKFPECNVNTVNAGIGGTNSYLGVNRVDDQVLSYNPDVVVVEFSVNDTDKVLNKYSYDSLVRKILNCDSQPAVMLLFTTQEDGTSLWETHKEIGAAYDLPMLSYRAVVYPEVSAGTLDWKDISPDNIHPNDEGHKLIGQLVSRYLDSVYDDLDNIDDSSVAFDTPAYTADYYKDAKMLGASDITPREISGFEQGGNSVYPELFPDNFVTEGEGYLKFETECK